MRQYHSLRKQRISLFCLSKRVGQQSRKALRMVLIPFARAAARNSIRLTASDMRFARDMSCGRGMRSAR